MDSRISRRALLGGAAALAVVGPTLLAPRRAAANVFGPPWQGVVTAERAVTRRSPSQNADPIGPLGRGAIVPVTGELNGWYATTVGYLPADVLREKNEPWIAEVAVEQTPLRMGPLTTSGVRRQARQGDLLRVTGISPDLTGGGAPKMWWATSEGWIDFDAIRGATGEWAGKWTLPSPDEAPNGWWAEVTTGSNVRLGPTTESPKVGLLPAGKHVKVLSESQGENVLGSATWYRIDGGRYAGAWLHSSLVKKLDPPQPAVRPPSGEAPDNTWIVVDRPNSTLTLVENGKPSLATYVSLGNAAMRTPAGTYTTFGKYRYNDMTSTSVPDPSHPYDLPNVPSTQYFREGGYAIHGTYWHDDFGMPHSEGCINMTMTDGAFLFPRTKPDVPPGEIIRYANNAPATPVVIFG